MKFSVFDSTPIQERTIRLEITGNERELIDLVDDLCNCYGPGIELKDALERAK